MSAVLCVSWDAVLGAGEGEVSALRKAVVSGWFEDVLAVVVREREDSGSGGMGGVLP